MQENDISLSGSRTMIRPADIILSYYKKGSRVFSVCGSGGKSSFIRLASLELCRRYKTGVAASTKMLFPDQTWAYEGQIPRVYEMTAEGSEDDPLAFFTNQIMAPDQHGLTKIYGLEDHLLSQALDTREIMLIEADGSARKPLKGWGRAEPVISHMTDVTIGIIPLHMLGQPLSEEQVHRCDIFQDITGLKKGDIMTAEAYVNLILHSQGLFKSAKGYKVLILNRVDNEERVKLAKLILRQVGDNIDGGYYGYLF